MSEKSATTCTVLHLRFKLRVPPAVLLGHSREAANIIASVEGLIWKICVLHKEEFEMGGIYLFTNRETAEAYLNHTVIQAVRSNPAVRVHPVPAMGRREFPLSSYSGSVAGYLRAGLRTKRVVGRRSLMQTSSIKLTKEDRQQRIEQFASQVGTDLAAAMAGVMTNLGHKRGLYRAMAESGPINSDELARRTATNERSIREWLNGQVGTIRQKSPSARFLRCGQLVLQPHAVPISLRGGHSLRSAQTA